MKSNSVKLTNFINFQRNNFSQQSFDEVSIVGRLYEESLRKVESTYKNVEHIFKEIEENPANNSEIVSRCQRILHLEFELMEHGSISQPRFLLKIASQLQKVSICNK